MDFFQTSHTMQQYGSEYRATLYVDCVRKEAYLSFVRDRRLFIALFPVKYGKVWNERLARKLLERRQYGWSFMTTLARHAVLEKPMEAAAYLDEIGLSVR